MNKGHSSGCLTKNEASLADFRTVRGFKVLYRRNTCDEDILEDGYQRPRFFAPGYEPQEDDIILDLGAHIGIFALQAAIIARKGRVYAVEADEENYGYLQKNIEINKLSNISCSLVAFARHRGTVRLYDVGSSWAYTICKTESDTFKTVPSDTLENFIADNRIHRIDYMKMNIEGAEYEVLLGAPPTILKRIKRLLVEFHPFDEHNEGQIVQYLEQCGFSVQLEHSVSTKGKGWISATNNEILASRAR